MVPLDKAGATPLKSNSEDAGGDVVNIDRFRKKLALIGIDVPLLALEDVNWVAERAGAMEVMADAKGSGSSVTGAWAISFEALERRLRTRSGRSGSARINRSWRRHAPVTGVLLDSFQGKTNADGEGAIWDEIFGAGDGSRGRWMTCLRYATKQDCVPMFHRLRERRQLREVIDGIEWLR